MSSIDLSRRNLLSNAALATGVVAASAIFSDLSNRAFAAETPAALGGSPFTTHGAAPKESVPFHTSRKYKVETVTPENFAPFGVVLSDQGRKRLPINTYGDKFDLYREGFESDQPIEWFIVTGKPRGANILFLERHKQLTQTFIPLGGKGFYTFVAAPTAKDENGFVAIDEIHAFFVPGDVAIQIHRGTWHENPLPTSEGVKLLVTSHANLTLAHQQNPDPKLKDLPLDLECRWYKAGGYDLQVEV